MNHIFLRNSAKAIIIKDNKVLLIQKQHPGNPVFSVFPGGGQEPGETLPEALSRECREEIGATITVGELLFIREYRSWEHAFSNPKRPHHQIEFFFLCELTGSLNPNIVDNPDPGQLGVLWADANDLGQVNLYPRVLIPLIQQVLSHSEKPAGPVYLGSVN